LDQHAYANDTYSSVSGGNTLREIETQVIPVKPKDKQDMWSKAFDKFRTENPDIGENEYIRVS